MRVIETTRHEYEVNVSSSLSTAGPSDYVAASSSGTVTSCVNSILDRLKCLKHSELVGKRKIWTNPPPVGKRTCRIKRRKIGNIRKSNRQPI